MERNSRFNMVLVVIAAGIWIYIMYKVLSIYFRRDTELPRTSASAEPASAEYDYRLSLKYDMPFDIGEIQDEKKENVRKPPDAKPKVQHPYRYIGKICTGKHEVMVLEINGEYVYTAEDAGLNGKTCRIAAHSEDTVTVIYNEMTFNVCIKEK